MKPIGIENYRNDPDMSLRMQAYARQERARIIGEFAIIFAAHLRARLSHLHARLSHLRARLSGRFARLHWNRPRATLWG